MILADVDQEKEINGEFQPDGSYVPRTLFIDPDGNVSDKLVGSDPLYPHSLDPEKPDELLALMEKARQVFDVAPATPPPANKAILIPRACLLGMLHSTLRLAISPTGADVVERVDTQDLKS